jgi:prolyl-tRNA synthetase
VAAGIYGFQPLGFRSLHKMMAIVRRDLDRAGALEVFMPAVQPAELWQESGRWEKYGKELLRIRDRHDRDFCFGPTHEEVFTDLVRHYLRSYRQLPVNLYQIQTKFRDEIRPRFGLMRGREFMMKDAYSFHTSEESLHEAYEAMRLAYCRILEACGLDYSVVEADLGTIGGSSSHEVMVLAATGESAVVRCPQCGYAANVEKAETRLPVPPRAAEGAAREVATPGLKSVREVATYLEVSPSQLVKTLVYETDAEPVAVVVRGDREVNEVKLLSHLGARYLALAGEETVKRMTAAPVGFAGPVGLPKGLRLLADSAARELAGFVCGANKADAHLIGVEWQRDARPDDWADLMLVGDGDPCPRCDGTLVGFRGIEVGHIFKLGTVYSEPMGCTFTDESGGDHPMLMGCYGFGIGRTLAAAIEQNHDPDGIIWPLPLAPFSVLLIGLNPREAAVHATTERFYAQLLEAGVEVLYDDRDERPGVKFKDADLVGIPIRLVVGAKGLAEGKVELSARRDREKHLIAVDDAVPRIASLLREPR